MRAQRKSEPVNDAAKAADESGIYLDPDLAAIRDREAEAQMALPPVAPRGLVGPPSIDPELVKLRGNPPKGRAVD